MWFVEKYDGIGLMIEGEKIFEKDGLQKIEIFSTKLGKMLVIDGKIQFSEADEKFYHEMLVHVPMLLHPEPKKVLIVGGGDGGAAREILKHGVESIKLVEIDENVIEACKKYIGIDEGALNDERVEIIIEDGIEFVKNCKEKFDVIIVDGSDPDAVSKPLISRDFYSRCSEIGEIFVTQSQSPFMQQEYFEAILKNSSPFSWRRIYLSFMPTYPSGMWSFMVASRHKISFRIEEIEKRYEERGIQTIHYTPRLHLASFTLPKWVEEIVKKYME